MLWQERKNRKDAGTTNLKNFIKIEFYKNVISGFPTMILFIFKENDYITIIFFIEKSEKISL